ncbi:hypothetical protein LXL04_012213 [Taraxacum kok-saghyz]
MYPRLAVLDVDLGCTVAERWSSQGWRWHWSRELTGGVSYEQMVELGHKLLEVRCLEDRDRWQWRISQDGEFTVTDTRTWIDNIVLPTSAYSTRWCDWVPRKVNIFVWRVMWKRLPTRGLLQSRGINVASMLCPICSEEEESLSHVLGTCEVANTVWRLIFRWMQLQGVEVLGPDVVFEWVDGVKEINATPPVSNRPCTLTLLLIEAGARKRKIQSLKHEVNRTLLQLLKEKSEIWFERRVLRWVCLGFLKKFRKIEGGPGLLLVLRWLRA